MPKRTNALWFFFALFGGGAFILWSKNAFPKGWFAASIAAGVVLALAVYYMLNDEDAPEEEGDNVYYLGLLFTLISLMYTLVELFSDSTDVVHSTEKIRSLLENFGIALTSTVVGIVGRVMVQNWQRTGAIKEPKFPDDSEIPPPSLVDANSRDLESFNRQLLGRIARDLTQGANALARFHRIVRSHASDSEEHLRNHSEVLKQESIAFKDTLQRNAEIFSQELKSQANNTLSTVGESLGSVAKQAEDLLEQLHIAREGYLNDLRETTQVFHDEVRSSSGQSLNALQRNFDDAAKKSHTLVQDVSTSYEQVSKEYDRLNSVLGYASNASEALGNSANNAAKSTAALESETDKLRSALVSLHAGSEVISSTLDTMSRLNEQIRTGRDAEQTAETVREIGEVLRDIATEGAAATEQATKAAELYESLIRSIQATEEEIKHASEALRVLSNEAEERINLLRDRQGSGLKFWNRWR